MMAILLNVSPSLTMYGWTATLTGAASVIIGGALVATTVCVRSSPTGVGVKVGRGTRIVVPGPGNRLHDGKLFSRTMISSTPWLKTRCPYW